MENHPTEANRNSDKKMKMEVDWTHYAKEAGAIEKNGSGLDTHYAKEAGAIEKNRIRLEFSRI
jgi:hypothetical protein